MISLKLIWKLPSKTVMATIFRCPATPETCPALVMSRRLAIPSTWSAWLVKPRGGDHGWKMLIDSAGIFSIIFLAKWHKSWPNCLDKWTWKPNKVISWCFFVAVFHMDLAHRSLYRFFFLRCHQGLYGGVCGWRDFAGETQILSDWHQVLHWPIALTIW